MGRNSKSIIKEMIPSKWARWTAYWSLWVLFGLFATVHWYYLMPIDFGYIFLTLLRAKLGIWITWGGMTLFIIWLSGKIPVTEDNWKIAVPKLLLGGVLVILAYLVVWATWITIANSPPNPGRYFPAMIGFSAGMHSSFFFLMYCATVATQQFYRITEERHQKELATAELKTELSNLHLQRLRSQLQPHFLFNALNTISSMVIQGKPEEAHNTLTDMSDLLRMSLDNSSIDFVSLKQEMQFVERYMNVITSRFPDRIQFIRKINNDVYDAKLPSLLLQPLIENAIKHGVTDSPGKGFIQIEGLHEKDNLVLTISNTISKNNGHNGNGNGIGLKNVRERLFLLYGERGTLDILRPDDETLSVQLSLPYQVFESK